MVNLGPEPHYSLIRDVRHSVLADIIDVVGGCEYLIVQTIERVGTVVVGLDQR